MKFNLIINPSHRWQQSNEHALMLFQTMIDQGHDVVSVFFYGDAAQIAQNQELQKAWLELKSNTAFLLCRTMIEEFDIQQQLIPGFKVVGMGQLALNMEQADRTLELS